MRIELYQKALKDQKIYSESLKSVDSLVKSNSSDKEMVKNLKSLRATIANFLTTIQTYLAALQDFDEVE